MMSKYPFRTGEQIWAIYQELAAQGDSKKPYILEYTANPKQTLYYCGANHSNNSNNSQYEILLEHWNKFIQHTNTKKIVMCEGGVRDVGNLTMEEAISIHSDPGFACWMALKNEIELISPEPANDYEISVLVNEFGSAKTILYYFTRQMHQWARGDFAHSPNWREYAEKTINCYNQELFPDFVLTVDNVLAVFENETGTAFAWSAFDLIYKNICPHPGSVSERSGQVRDECIFENIQNYWNMGYDVFIVYGSGHAIVHEPALDLLTAC